MSGSAQAFIPPLCPCSRCPVHRSTLGWRWVRHGFYARQAFPQCIQWFRCATSGNGRETIAFSNRRQSVERAAVLLVWRTFIRRFSERRGGPTPAIRLGLTKGPLTLERVLERRLFPSRIAMPRCWQRCYRREIPTLDLPRRRRHMLKLAI